MNWLLQNIPKLNIFIDLELDRKNGLLGKNIQDIDRGLLLQSLSLISSLFILLLRVGVGMVNSVWSWNWNKSCWNSCSSWKCLLVVFLFCLKRLNKIKQLFLLFCRILPWKFSACFFDPTFSKFSRIALQTFRPISTIAPKISLFLVFSRESFETVREWPNLDSIELYTQQDRDLTNRL
jgi:hypothetical protein